MEKEINYYEKNQEESLELAKTNINGLSINEAKKRLLKFGPNTLPKEKIDNYFILFLKQFKSPLIYALIIISIITFFLKEYTDSIIIAFVLFFNAFIGVIQEGKAERTMASLRNLTSSNVLVKREGKEIVISSESLVEGDIMMLREGEKIPSDIRILECKDLLVNEAALTGESESVSKTNKKISGKKLILAEQVNMLFAGTFINVGNVLGLVVKTGKNTEIGKIADLIQKSEPEIPLKTALKKLTNITILAISIFSILFFIAGILKGTDTKEMFLMVSSLLVAVIPEGLPVILTLVLAQGVKKMAEKNVLVKKLQAVETLGQAKILAVDKTGTITKNELSVQKILIGAKIINITADGYSASGDFFSEVGKKIEPQKDEQLSFLGKLATLSANAKIFRNKENNSTEIVGDPTEAAMLVVGEKLKFNKKKLLEENPIIDEIPFKYQNKYYANLHEEKSSKEKILIISGAPEVLLKKSKFWRKENITSEITEEDTNFIYEKISSLSNEGLRVIALAYKKINADKNHIEETDTENLEIIGFFAMKDGIRSNVLDSVNKARQAGLKIIMITGDRKETAFAIAKEANIATEGQNKVLTGQEIDTYDNLALKRAVLETTVFARVTPEHKLKIIKAYQENGMIIAMTGDGVNDVPSLANANLGVAMGKTGTEVAKEASDLVLLDDNFGNIPEAVEEGRHIYLSIKKALLYLFATNLAEMLLVVVAYFIGLNSPFEPAQIIWLNLITDSFMVLPLALEPKDKNVMQKSFKQTKSLIDRQMLKRLVFLSTLMTIICLSVFKLYLKINPEEAKTMTLTTMVVCQFITAWVIRSNNKPIWKNSPFKNKWLIYASVLIVFLQLFANQNSVFQKILSTVPLSITDWLIALGFGFIYLTIDQARILFAKKNKQDKVFTVL